jgi:GNAT superfamily N-acetyltransferase
MGGGLSIALATVDEARAVAALRNAVASVLTQQHGLGHWSSMSSEKGIRSSMRRSSIYVAREGECVVGTLELATKKPWAIDRRYFTDVTRPIYLLGMAVDPDRQRTGIGRQCITYAVVCEKWPADALCLDMRRGRAPPGFIASRIRQVGLATATRR